MASGKLSHLDLGLSIQRFTKGFRKMLAQIGVQRDEIQFLPGSDRC